MASKTSSNRPPSLVAERYDQMTGATHSRSVERCLSQARCQSLRQQGSKPDRRGQDYGFWRCSMLAMLTLAIKNKGYKSGESSSEE